MQKRPRSFLFLKGALLAAILLALTGAAFYVPVRPGLPSSESLLQKVPAPVVSHPAIRRHISAAARLEVALRSHRAVSASS